MTKNWKNFTAEFFFFIKNCNLPLPRLPLLTPKLQEKPSALKNEHLAFQNMKFFHFCGSFLSSWIWICIRIFECGSESGSSNSNECGSGSIRIQIRNPGKIIRSHKRQSYLKPDDISDLRKVIELKGLTAGSIEWLIEDQASYCRMIRLLGVSSPPLPQQLVSLSQSSCVLPVELTGGWAWEGVGNRVQWFWLFFIILRYV